MLTGRLGRRCINNMHLYKLSVLDIVRAIQASCTYTLEIYNSYLLHCIDAIELNLDEKLLLKLVSFLLLVILSSLTFDELMWSSTLTGKGFKREVGTIRGKSWICQMS